MEKMQGALETLTEPHKLTASTLAVVSVARTLVYPGPKYPEGPTHVIPLLVSDKFVTRLSTLAC
jgi:proteasome activator subunit 4